MPSTAALLLAFAATIPAPAGPLDKLEELQADLGRLRAQVVGLDGVVRAREERLDGLAKELAKLNESLTGALKAPVFPISGPFLSGPPLASDSAGVAKVVVFAPKLDVDSSRRHDTVFLKVRRIEADSTKLVGETEIGQDATSVELPLDKSGALYVVEWSTSEGYNFGLLLRDGASGQNAASVQVKQLQAQGRFLFVGYRLE